MPTASDKSCRKIPLLNENGQTFIEYVLLMVVTMVVSLLMLKGVNTNLSTYWHAMATKIVDDPTENFQLR